MKSILVILIIIALISCADKSPVEVNSNSDTLKTESVFLYNPNFVDSGYWADRYIEHYLEMNQSSLNPDQNKSFAYLKDIQIRSGRKCAQVRFGLNTPERFIVRQYIYVDSATKSISVYNAEGDSSNDWNYILQITKGLESKTAILDTFTYEGKWLVFFSPTQSEYDTLLKAAGREGQEFNETISDYDYYATKVFLEMEAKGIQTECVAYRNFKFVTKDSSYFYSKQESDYGFGVILFDGQNAPVFEDGAMTDVDLYQLIEKNLKYTH